MYTLVAFLLIAMRIFGINMLLKQAGKTITYTGNEIVTAYIPVAIVHLILLNWIYPDNPTHFQTFCFVSLVLYTVYGFGECIFYFSRGEYTRTFTNFRIISLMVECLLVIAAISVIAWG